MKRFVTKKNTDENMFGSDSFLDVVANMVGILIILVVIVSLRVKNTAAQITSVPSEPPKELLELKTESVALEEDIHRLFNLGREIEMAAAVKEKERNQLALVLEKNKQDWNQFQQQMDAGTHESLEIQRRIAESRTRLEQLKHYEAASQVPEKLPSVVLENQPTPKSETVLGQEIHFQLHHQKLAYVPLIEVVPLLKQEFERNVQRLMNQPELTQTFGPIEGFRIRYTMQRLDLNPVEHGRAGAMVRLKHMELLPIETELGDTLEVALADHSEFRSRLTEFNPRRSTITLWVYPDSFAEFQTLKKELYRLGYPVASRPLTGDQPIGASPSGSRSAAQ